LGDQFKIVTREVIADWRLQQEAIAARKRAEQEQREREAREQAERERERQQSGDDCDRLAANSTDAKRVTEGVTFEQLGQQADQAYYACTKDVASFPSIRTSVPIPTRAGCPV
jgi:hypothetical protein